MPSAIGAKASLEPIVASSGSTIKPKKLVELMALINTPTGTQLLRMRPIAQSPCLKTNKQGNDKKAKKGYMLVLSNILKLANESIRISANVAKMKVNSPA